MPDSKFSKNFITPKSTDFEKWYTDVILKAELADYAPVKGCMIFRPYGYGLWEKIQSFMDEKIKLNNVENAYFPLFIPEQYLDLEKEHVQGFSPHLAVVTIAGGEKLEKRLVVRPTSETIMYAMYKKWFGSWRDFPVKINQWNNIVRWEKRTYMFLRTSEFLWQEGHCAHLSSEENLETVMWALDVYRQTYNDLMALYGIAGVKSQSEKFAGGDRTYSYELLMPSGKALQACTSHDLGQNFAKAFNWTVLNDKNEKILPFQNSWGFSTRSIGGLIMMHGDDMGLVLPPKISPIQVVIVPIKVNDKIMNFCGKLFSDLKSKGVRVKVDDRQQKTVGWKFNEWELKGVPLRIEVGEREIDENQFTLFRRDNKEKIKLGKDNITDEVLNLLEKIQKDLFEKSKKYTLENTRDANSYDQFKDIMAGPKGFIRAYWCENGNCEDKIKAETKATTRVLPLNSIEQKGKCVYCGKQCTHRWIFAQAY